jgi:hypothetical protein
VGHPRGPADWCTNADEVLAEIVRGLQDSATSMNASVLAKFGEGLRRYEDLPLSTVRAFFASDASVTFMDVT